MRHPLLMLHLLGLRLTDQLRQALEAKAEDPERGSVTIEQVARVLQKRLGGPDPEFPKTYRKGDIRHCFPDITRAKEALDWEPKHQLEDGVEDLVEWVASQVSHADALDAHVEELRKKGLLGSNR